MKKECIIVIPVYKEEISISEELSFIQCIKVCSNFPICLITYSDLDCAVYHKLSNKSGTFLRVEYFDRKFFTNNLDGYNSLMLSKHFYDRFRDYKYLLIYQLDAFVFFDNLLEWCKKKYDYIGAPWFDGFESYSEVNKLWAVGNGGLSLRRVSWYRKVLSGKMPIKKPGILWDQVPHNTFRTFASYLAQCAGRHNRIKDLLANIGNEDKLPMILKEQSWYRVNLPEPVEAMNFSFEKSPSYLYSINGNNLPFGCHAWLKNEYASFWKQFISIDCESETLDD